VVLFSLETSTPFASSTPAPLFVQDSARVFSYEKLWPQTQRILSHPEALDTSTEHRGHTRTLALAISSICSLERCLSRSLWFAFRRSRQREKVSGLTRRTMSAGYSSVLHSLAGHLISASPSFALPST